MKTSQLARQLHLIELLHSPRGHTLEQLAGTLNCSTRTVFRDLNCLEAAGIDVLFDTSDKHYSLAPHYGVPKPHLFGDELSALALAVETTPLARLPAFKHLLEQALGKFLPRAPFEQREQITRIVRASRIRSDEPVVDERLLRKLLLAIAGNEECRITVRTADGRITVHDQVTPVSVHYENQRWSFGFRIAAAREVLVVPIQHISDVEILADSGQAMGRHLLSDVRAH